MHDINIGDAARANSLEEHWMPFSGNRDFKENPRLVVKGEGMYYTDHKGGSVIDGSSALFCSPWRRSTNCISMSIFFSLR